MEQVAETQMEKRLIASLNTQSATETLKWAEKNPGAVCHILWWLIGYAHLDGLRPALKEVNNARDNRNGKAC